MSPMQSGFLDLARVIVPRDCATAAQDHLRQMGRRGAEGFALWAGVRDASDFWVEETVIPAQRALRFESGICVAVDSDELFRINVHLYKRGRALIAQLHSHPGDAYHSTTDDDYPIATTVGALSLVIPNFAAGRFSLDSCAVYRLLSNNAWARLNSGATKRLISLVE